MQFVLLIYQGTTPLPKSERWKSLPEDEQERVYADYAEIGKAPGVTPGLPLGLPKAAKTVRVHDGLTQASDGPYIDTMGAVGGYFVVEAGNVYAAIKLASRIPAARLGGAVEVRPVEKYW